MQNSEKGIIFDVHIHSRYSRATSKDLNIENLSHWAKIKGIDILGTGDFTHPLWLKELKQNLEESPYEGIYAHKDTKYILQVEINNIFTYQDKTRKVHNVILAKNFEIVEQINEILSKYGDLEEDGRPTLMISLEEMMELFDHQNLFKDLAIIPAHAWTPWFGVYGSKSGFDSLKEAFGKYHKKIFAIETGLSSDPLMNAQVPETYALSLISNSDAHSYWPWRLGREANIIYDEEVDFDKIIDNIKKKKIETIEVDPAYGKYHFDGHRKCGVCLDPLEAKRHNNLCPVCGKKLTLGVLHRVYDLSGSTNMEKQHEQKYYTLLPLHELISKVYNISMNSKSVWKLYNDLIKKHGNEMNILLWEKEENLQIEDKKLKDIIIKNRKGELKVKPGCDGEYGELILNSNQTSNKKAIQKRLFEG